MIDRKEIGLRLREAREKTGLSRDSVIALPEISISRTTLQQWEIGQTEPSLERLAKLAELYQVSPQWLIFGDDNTHPSPTTNNDTGITAEQAINTLKTLIQDTQPKLTEDEAFLLKEFRALDNDQKRLIIRFLIGGFDSLNNNFNKGIINSPNTKITGNFTNK